MAKKQQPEKKRKAESEVPIDLLEGFARVYANNTVFEPCIWDLKITFGQLVTSGDEPTIDADAEVTIPWLQAKVMAYYLQANLALYEAQYGRIKLPAVLHPSPMDKGVPLPPATKAFIEKLRADLIAE